MRICKGKKFWSSLPVPTPRYSRFAGKYPFRVRVYLTSTMTERPEDLYIGKPSASAFRALRRRLPSLLQRGRDVRVVCACPSGAIMHGDVIENLGIHWNHTVRASSSFYSEERFGSYQPLLESYFPYRTWRGAILVAGTPQALTPQRRRAINLQLSSISLGAQR